MSRVLGRPARGTGEGTGYHDGGGLRGPTHGAGDVVVVMAGDFLVLRTVDVTVAWRDGHDVVKLGGPGQTQPVWTTSFIPISFSPNNSCGTTFLKSEYGGGGAFPRIRGFLGKVLRIIPCLRFCFYM